METIDAKLARYREIIKRLLMEWAAIPYAVEGLRQYPFFDEPNDRYAVITEGWLGSERVLSIILNLEIINGKVWLQADNTDAVFARKLEENGIPKAEIVLGFRSPEMRTYTEYAAA